MANFKTDFKHNVERRLICYSKKLDNLNIFTKKIL